jgi:hypothetical protein
MYHPHSSTKKLKSRHYELIVTQHPSGALEAKLFKDVTPDEDNLIPIGSPNGRTSEHGFFTTLGLAIGEQFKKA